LDKIKTDFKGWDALPICAKIEEELAGLEKKERGEYLQSLGVNKSGLELLIRKAYSKLGLISFYTTGEKETRAWTIVKGAKAPQAAGVIHTDFEKGFIKAEVIGFKALLSAGGWTQAKKLGKIKIEGKEYLIKNGDVVEFRFNV